MIVTNIVHGSTNGTIGNTIGTNVSTSGTFCKFFNVTLGRTPKGTIYIPVKFAATDKILRCRKRIYIYFILFIQCFKRVAHLAVQLFYLAALCANIFTYIYKHYNHT